MRRALLSFLSMAICSGGCALQRPSNEFLGASFLLGAPEPTGQALREKIDNEIARGLSTLNGWKETGPLPPHSAIAINVDAIPLEGIPNTSSFEDMEVTVSYWGGGWDSPSLEDARARKHSNSAACVHTVVVRNA